jgi:hypothetical protein
MPRYHPIKYIDGEIIIIKSPSLAKSGELRQYHLELLKIWNGLTGWPPEKEIEIRVYDEYAGLYKSITQFLEPKPEPDRMSFADRYEFFVCTEPVQGPSELIAGLSKLSWLMGYEISDSDEETELPEQTTGNSELDLRTDLELVFKAGAEGIAANFSAEDCAKILIRASWRMSQQTEDSKSKTKNIKRRQPIEEVLPPTEDKGEFTRNQEAIEAGLRDLGVELPEGW